MNDWQNFYVIAGSAAGALIGLQFVVLTLLSSLSRRVSMQGANVYSTPTIIHFTTVLLLSAFMVAPMGSLGAYYAIHSVITLGGLAGFVYSLNNARHMRHAGYKPQKEDWLCYAILPLAAYALLAVSAGGVFSIRLTDAGLYGIALATIILLVIGIHNAWDTVTWHVFDRNEPPSQ
ncbi:MAG TPA: hypothetical protein VMU71_07530 [Terracidiphilus sp.]|jgi:hypothetical protein|nr:hypothetical protein [Terracidiphilus sp.]